MAYGLHRYTHEESGETGMLELTPNTNIWSSRFAPDRERVTKIQCQARTWQWFCTGGAVEELSCWIHRLI